MQGLVDTLMASLNEQSVYYNVGPPCDKGSHHLCAGAAANCQTGETSSKHCLGELSALPASCVMLICCCTASKHMCACCLVAVCPFYVHSTPTNYL